MTTAIARRKIQHESLNFPVSVARVSRVHRQGEKSKIVMISSSNVDQLISKTMMKKRAALFSADMAAGKQLRSIPKLKRMLLATTEALEHATERKLDPVSLAHQAISAKARKLLATID